MTSMQSLIDTDNTSGQHRYTRPELNKDLLGPTHTIGTNIGFPPSGYPPLMNTNNYYYCYYLYNQILDIVL